MLPLHYACKMAFPTGLEPVTPGLGNRCSIHLSYENILIGERALYYLSPGSTVSLGSSVSDHMVVFQVVDPLGLEPRTIRV